MLEHRPCHKKMENRAVVIGSDSLCFDMSGCRLCQGRWTGSNQSYGVCKITVFQPPRLSSLSLNLICSPLFSRLQGSAIFLSQDYLSSMLSMTLTTVVIGRRTFSCSTVRAIGWPSMIKRMLKPQRPHYIPQVGLTAGLPKAAMIPYPFTNHHCSDSQLWALPIYSTTKQVS